jgi:hypothetical protein
VLSRIRSLAVLTVVVVVLAGVSAASGQAAPGSGWRAHTHHGHHGHHQGHHHGHHSHHGGKHKNRADLDMVAVKSAYSGGEVRVSFLVRNKGRQPAPANVAEISISLDATADGIDTPVGQVEIPALAPHTSQQVDTVLPVPVAMTPTYYHVISCADALRTIKERTKYNNCRGTKEFTLSPAVVRADATKGGTIAVSNVTDGGCHGALCGFVPGSGSVTFTPTADVLYRFVGWSGCTGYATGPGDSITFSKIERSVACKASFAPLLKVGWSSTGTGSGSVAPSLSSPACSAAGATGSCTLGDGVSALTLVATPAVLSGFNGWSSGPDGPCDGVVSGTGGNTMTFDSMTEAKSCVAEFDFLGI